MTGSASHYRLVQRVNKTQPLHTNRQKSLNQQINAQSTEEKK